MNGYRSRRSAKRPMTPWETMTSAPGGRAACTAARLCAVVASTTAKAAGIRGIHSTPATTTCTSMAAAATAASAGPARRRASQVHTQTAPRSTKTTAARFWKAASAPMKTGDWFRALGTSTTSAMAAPSGATTPMVPAAVRYCQIPGARTRRTWATSAGWAAMPPTTATVPCRPVAPVTWAR